MEVEDVRDIITFALQHLQKDNVEVKAYGNRVYLVADNDEFEIVIRTMNPKGSSRLERPPLSP